MRYVLVPGAGGDAFFWHRVVPLLREPGHEAVAVDLPAGDDNAGLAAYADVIESAIGDGEDVTLVAQSLGGFSAPLVAARRRVGELVLVNAMIPVPGETGEAWWGTSGQREARAAKAAAEGRDLTEFDVAAEFFHDVPDDVVAAVMARGEPAQSGRPLTEAWPLSAWPTVPTRAAAGADDRFFPVEFQRRLVADRLGIDADVLPGGHCLALSQPEALARYLLTPAAR